MDFFSKLPTALKHWYLIKNQLYRKAVKADILPYTCQFFIDGLNGFPKATGSGVLIEYEGDKFLISAAHVLENAEEISYILLGVDAQRLGGQLFLSELPHHITNREDDYFDIAAMKLDDETIAILGRSELRFLPARRIERTHLIGVDNIYLTFGFPARKARLKYKNVVEALVLETNAVAEESCYRNYGITTKSNIISKYLRSQLFRLPNSLLRKGVKPYGISGCGLWAVKSFEQVANKPIPTALVGILTTWIPTDSNMIATSISKVLDFIDENF